MTHLKAGTTMQKPVSGDAEHSEVNEVPSTEGEGGGSPPLGSVHALRRRWKASKEALIAETPGHPTVIRLHRAFSWLQRVEQFPEGADDDLVLVCQWIALNGLYGQWNEQSREPMADRECWRRFFDRLLKLDNSKHLETALLEQRKLVMLLLDDEHLSSFFWREPTEVQARRSKKAKFDARTWYVERRWGLLLDRLLERAYLMRCQLVHGAASYGSQLNRETLERCRRMLRHLLLASIMVIIDHGAEEDWGAMCYPPLGG
jgi:hypothetical protein